MQHPFYSDSTQLKPPIKSTSVRLPWRTIVYAWIGATLTIACLGAITQYGDGALPMVIGSFGGSCMLVFGYHEHPFSQPRNIVFGHILASSIGLLFLTIFGGEWWAMGFAAGTSIAAMMAVRVVHPPAASNTIIIFLAKPTWTFLLYPTAGGAICILLLALLFNRIVLKRPYPQYW